MECANTDSPTLRLEAALDSKSLEADKARKDIDKFKEDWSKKIQSGHDKVAALEAKLKRKGAEFDTMKVWFQNFNRNKPT